MISIALKVRLRPGDRGDLETRLRAATTEQQHLLRIRIASEGHGPREIARELEPIPTKGNCGASATCTKVSAGWRWLRVRHPPIYAE
jgi:hypothetical protein